eukprot:CAMPEP_0169421936 /NCGR_PEP_ID=MMETSP1017-20121227/66590_1 /TAXON_ID=342587 /ORGANISM="Karlodinium micrum, Strain CCMP2283" /LENGTH=97 /DNA_ID=CAMNT_0009531321 /DNA_START=48 /DNA_END=338 /DNA_ORIENTATION=-
MASPEYPVDWPSAMWSEMGIAGRRLESAVAALDKIKQSQQRRHVRANRYEEAYEDAVFAERDMLNLQKQLALPGAALVSHSEWTHALEIITAASCHW